MISRVGLFLFSISLMALLQAGCGNSDGEPGKILSQPPFAALADSIKKEPDNPRHYLARAILLSQNNHHELATPDYYKAWQLSSDEAVALEYISNLLLVNRTGDALSFLDECRKKFPDNLEFGRRLSEIYAQLGKRKEALAEYDKILEQDSLNFMAWYEKGLLLVKLNDTAAAIEALEKSYSIQPVNYTGLALANIYSSQENPRVLAICDDILQRDSTGEVSDALLLKGIFFSDKKDFAKALSLFEECIKRDWKFIQAYLEKGIVYFKQKDYPKALETFQMATTVSSTNGDAYYWLGRVYEETNDKKQAIENYERAYSLDKTIIEAQEALDRLDK
jgi:tetratricopeptide (TPR) repeat protein